jgi:rhomboid protease GluP
MTNRRTKSACPEGHVSSEAMANCVRCGKELPTVTIGDLKDTCVECQVRERIARAQQEKANRPSFWQIAQMFPATSVLVAINVVVYAGCALQSLKTGVGSPMDFDAYMLVPWGADFGPLTLDGQWWRILTSMFVHGGLIHVGANMWCFWDIGRLAERIYGRWKFVILYLLTGLASSVASLAMHPTTVSVGASGAIFGVAGTLVFPFYRKRVVLPPQALKAILRSLVTFIGVNLLIGSAIPMIDNAAHMGGLLAGLLLGALVTKLAASRDELSALFPRLTVVSVVLIGFAFAGVQRLHQGAIAEQRGYYELERGNLTAAQEDAKKALAKNPNSVLAHLTLGEVYWQKERFGEAAQEFHAAYVLKPKDSDIAGALGASYVALNQWKTAEPFLRQAIEANPDDAASLENLGRALAAQNRLDEALVFLQRAVAKNPQSAKANYALGAVLMDQHKYQQAVAPLSEAVKLEPKNEDYKKTLDAVTAELSAKTGESK